MGAVISGYEAGRSLRTSESRGGFRSSAENNGQAGGLTYGAAGGLILVSAIGRGDDGADLICLGRLSQSLRTTFRPNRLRLT